jgi:hypothetical protein
MVPQSRLSAPVFFAATLYASSIEKKALVTENERMRYIIRVKGHLDTYWQTWLENLLITHERDGTTLLSGPIKDQAALYGILIKMRDLGLTLLSLEESAPIKPPEE